MAQLAVTSVAALSMVVIGLSFGWATPIPLFQADTSECQAKPRLAGELFCHAEVYWSTLEGRYVGRCYPECSGAGTARGLVICNQAGTSDATRCECEEDQGPASYCKGDWCKHVLPESDHLFCEGSCPAPVPPNPQTSCLRTNSLVVEGQIMKQCCVCRTGTEVPPAGW